MSAVTKRILGESGLVPPGTEGDEARPAGEERREVQIGREIKRLIHAYYTGGDIENAPMAEIKTLADELIELHT